MDIVCGSRGNNKLNYPATSCLSVCCCQSDAVVRGFRPLTMCPRLALPHHCGWLTLLWESHRKPHEERTFPRNNSEFQWRNFGNGRTNKRGFHSSSPWHIAVQVKSPGEVGGRGWWDVSPTVNHQSRCTDPLGLVRYTLLVILLSSLGLNFWTITISDCE